jgi:hypothetical protein
MGKDSVGVTIEEGVQKPLSRDNKAWTEPEHSKTLETKTDLTVFSQLHCRVL